MSNKKKVFFPPVTLWHENEIERKKCWRNYVSFPCTIFFIYRAIIVQQVVLSLLTLKIVWFFTCHAYRISWMIWTSITLWKQQQKHWIKECAKTTRNTWSGNSMTMSRRFDIMLLVNNLSNHKVWVTLDSINWIRFFLFASVSFNVYYYRSI